MRLWRRLMRNMRRFWPISPMDFQSLTASVLARVPPPRFSQSEMLIMQLNSCLMYQERTRENGNRLQTQFRSTRPLPPTAYLHSFQAGAMSPRSFYVVAFNLTLLAPRDYPDQPTRGTTTR